MKLSFEINLRFISPKTLEILLIIGILLILSCKMVSRRLFNRYSTSEEINEDEKMFLMLNSAWS
ncbi:18768_t:CDS:2 [Gigaspora rosea]|nr:18768_t:CDS:2 [Gigaspora rosea]